MRALSSVAEFLTLTDRGDVNTTDDDAPHPYCPTVRVVANWHNGVHDGAFATCQEQPCLAVKKVSD